MPTYTQTNQKTLYLPRTKFNQETVKNIDLSSITELPSEAPTPKVPGGYGTSCKVCVALGVLCAIGSISAFALAFTIGANNDVTQTTTTITTATTSTSTSATTTTSTSSTSSATTTTETTTTTTRVTSTTTTALQALSLLATVTASGFYSGAGTATAQGDYLVGRAVGGSFNSGGYAPQYVQLELPGTYSISSVCLNVGQFPNGVTQHNLYAGATTGSLAIINSWNSFTSAGQWLNVTFSPMLTGIRFLRISTVSSPSWVAWNKFLVYGV